MRKELDQLRRFADEKRRDLSARFFKTYDIVLARVRRAHNKLRGLPDSAVLARAKRADKYDKDTQDNLPVVENSAVPDGICVYAFGDVHGRADLLERLFDKVEADINAHAKDENIVLVFLGDYIDRGFQSRDVIDFLLSDRVSKYQCIFLKGNHEEALMKFMQEPSFGPRWAGYGGLETLTSYNVRPPRIRTAGEEWVAACDALNEAMPAEHRRFFNTLEISATIGDYVFVHAGLKPGTPIEEQVEDDALWIREEFLNDKSSFGLIVVHGHTPISAPYRDFRRIGIDTGAYLSGKLTAACFMRSDVKFIST
ncbi:MAG: metallophosphoesterase family protein [Hyphomonadaceae bacterium]